MDSLFAAIISHSLYLLEIKHFMQAVKISACLVAYLLLDLEMISFTA
jgi:hypothetical protein